MWLNQYLRPVLSRNACSGVYCYGGSVKRFPTRLLNLKIQQNGIVVVTDVVCPCLDLITSRTRVNITKSQLYSIYIKKDPFKDGYLVVSSAKPGAVLNNITDEAAK